TGLSGSRTYTPGKPRATRRRISKAESTAPGRSSTAPFAPKIGRATMSPGSRRFVGTKRIMVTLFGHADVRFLPRAARPFGRPAHGREAEAVERARPVLQQGPQVLPGAVAFVRGKAVRGPRPVPRPHDAVPDDLGHDAGRGHFGHQRVAPHHGPLRHVHARDDMGAVHVHLVGLHRQRQHALPHGLQRGPQDVGAIDAAGRGDAKGHGLRAGHDFGKQALPRLGGQPLRIGQPVGNEGAQHHRRRDHRPRPRPAAGLVPARHHPGFAAASRHRAPSASWPPAGRPFSGPRGGGLSSVRRPRRPLRKSAKTRAAARSRSGSPPGSSAPRRRATARRGLSGSAAASGPQRAATAPGNRCSSSRKNASAASTGSYAVSGTAPVAARSTAAAPVVLSGHKTPGLSSSSSPGPPDSHCRPRVTPAVAPVAAFARPARLLMAVDLPTLGRPATSTRVAPRRRPASRAAARSRARARRTHAPPRRSAAAADWPRERKYSSQALVMASSARSALESRSTRGSGRSAAKSRG